MTHPTWAEDPVGLHCGEMTQWALDWATNVMVASRKHKSREERAEALRKAAEVWPKLTRRWAQLEELAPKLVERGYAKDGDMQDVLDVMRERIAG